MVIEEPLSEDLAVDPETRVIDQQILREMGERLPEPYRQVIDMRLDHELSTREIAGRLNASPSNVASRLHRGVHILTHSFMARIAKKRRLP